MVLERSPNGVGEVTGECDFCGWTTVAGGYPEVVTSYQDHLRREHPRVWLRR